MNLSVDAELLVESLTAFIEKQKAEIELLKKQLKSNVAKTHRGDGFFSPQAIEFTEQKQEPAIAPQLRGQLLLKGMSISEWARKNNYRENLVTGLISRFAGKEGRPQKGLSLEVIEKLEAETGIKICG